MHTNTHTHTFEQKVGELWHTMKRSNLQTMGRRKSEGISHIHYTMKV